MRVLAILSLLTDWNRRSNHPENDLPKITETRRLYTFASYISIKALAIGVHHGDPGKGPSTPLTKVADGDQRTSVSE
jgi:hypothetical protein